MGLAQSGGDAWRQVPRRSVEGHQSTVALWRRLPLTAPHVHQGATRREDDDHHGQAGKEGRAVTGKVEGHGHQIHRAKGKSNESKITGKIKNPKGYNGTKSSTRRRRRCQTKARPSRGGAGQCRGDQEEEQEIEGTERERTLNE